MAFSYPAQAERFTPASCNMDDPKARLEETVNAYDNSIVDLDASIHRMIALLKNRPAIYFYCSDHGVALGEEGKMFQDHILPPVYRPAMFIWYSDAFASRYPDMVRALKANRLKAVSHDHIFHTLLSPASIRSEIVRNDLNLASPDARETPAPSSRKRWRNGCPFPHRRSRNRRKPPRAPRETTGCGSSYRTRTCRGWPMHSRTRRASASQPAADRMGRSLVPNRPHVPFKGFSVRDLPEQVGTAFRIHRTAFRNPGHDYGGSQASVILPGPAPCGHQAAGLPVLHDRFIIISALSGIHSHTGLHRFSPRTFKTLRTLEKRFPASSVTLRVSATRTPPPMSHGA